jgi:hypothetical protein
MMLNKFWSRWKKFTKLMGDFVARNVLTFFYFTIALPFGLIMRFTQDPMNLKPKAKSNWTPHQDRVKDINEARRLF